MQMSVVAGIITFFLAFLLSWSILRPFWAGVEIELEPCSDSPNKESQLKIAIEELETEKLMGKISDEEFTALKHELAIETARASIKSETEE